jgi:isopentenyl-diphosphate delta-isomerase
MEEKDSLGVKRAAQRKLEHELGIKMGSVGLDEMHFLTRIYYKAHCKDGIWGEHEVDHILFVQKDVEFEFNPNEIKSTRWVTPAQLRQIFEDYQAQQTRKEKGETISEEDELLISPWFHMICKRFFYQWWADLDQVMKDQGLDPAVASAVHTLNLTSDETAYSGTKTEVVVPSTETAIPQKTEAASASA